MANQSDGNAFDSSSLSQVPKVRSFEFDDKAIGNIRSSVNKFRGSVSLPMDFLSLLGREGLDVKLSAIYSSNIRRELTTWNLDAPTGILGLGWQLPIEMIALDPQGSGAPATNRYYLISNGSANPMVRTGVAPDGKWTFQLRNFEFWSVLYDPANQIWTIVKENGFVYTYGGGHGTSGAAQWGVRWGNWIGSSSQRAAQTRYPIAWNLSSIVSPMGHGIYYEYRNVNQKVMANGLEYTQASYIGKVTDSFGRTLTFNYGNKYGALNPGTFNGRPIIEYQARHTQLPAPNAYQDRYETLFLDSVDVANASGTPVYGIKFTYSFVNQASSGDPSYPLLTKRCLRSVFQYAPNGDTLPPIRFDYVDQSSDINPCALNRVIYPSGGRASFVYKQNYIAQARKVTIVNPLPGSVPRVWFGSDYAVFTWQGTSGMRVIVQAWAGQWVTQDVTGPMGGKAAATDSLLVLTGENFFAVTFRDSSSKNDEIYFFRNDDRGTELRFGTWILSNGQGIVLALNNPSTGPSTFVSGQDFVICRNKDYTAGGFQGFSYSWQSGRWNSTLTRDADAPPLPPANTAATTALTADQNYYVASAFDAQSRSIRSNHFYRDADGAWQSSTSNSWALSGVDVVTSGGNLLLALSPMPTGVVMTYVTGTSVNTINYNLRVFQWNESYHVINVGSPGRIDLTSPVTGGKSLYNIFQTLISGGLVNNNQGLLRDIGGDQSIAGAWATRLFSAPPAGASVAVAAGDDVALLSVTGATRSNQLVTFNPNNNIWSTPPIVQTESFPSISDDYLTTGRFIYRRGTDGSWAQTPVQLANFNFPESLRNFGPRYIVYQDSNSTAAATRIVALRNGAVINLSPLTAEKFYVGEAKAGTVLSGPRFLATYPAASASFDVAPSLNLYDLSDVSLDAYVADTPVAYIEIDDAHDPSQNYYASFFYANSSESQIVYNAATGVSQYPMVMVVPGVAANSAAPPSVQPQGRSEFNYSNGLARQSSLYPAGGVQNYQNILNGIELASRIYDSTNKLVAFQLNYWTVYSRDSRGRNLYGGYARCERTTTSRDGIAQEASAAYDRGTGVLLWQEKSYTDAAGAAKRVREETLYAYQVPEYAQAFTDQHDFLSAAMGTRSVSTAGQPARAYVQSQVTTYRDWSNQSAVTIGGAARGTARLAAYEVYDWTAPGQTAPVFSFGAGARTGWLLRTRILSRCMPGGLITEQTDGTGLVSSFVYDTAQ